MSTKPSLTAIEWLTERARGVRAQPESSVTIETLDNPGWLLRARLPHGRDDLALPLTGRVDDTPDWNCLVTNEGQLYASGGAMALVSVIRSAALHLDGANVDPREVNIEALCEWYASCCDGDWEHSYGVVITGLPDGGWSFEANLLETEHQEKQLHVVRGSQNGTDWISLEVRDATFRANCGPANLAEAIRAFNHLVLGSQGIG